jgi:hypothetical protein
MMRVHRCAQVVRQLVQWKVARVVDKFDGTLQQAALPPPLAVLQAHTHARIAEQVWFYCQDELTSAMIMMRMHL